MDHASPNPDPSPLHSAGSFWGFVTTYDNFHERTWWFHKAVRKMENKEYLIWSIFLLNLMT